MNKEEDPLDPKLDDHMHIFSESWMSLSDRLMLFKQSCSHSNLEIGKHRKVPSVPMPSVQDRRRAFTVFTKDVKDAKSASAQALLQVYSQNSITKSRRSSAPLYSDDERRDSYADQIDPNSTIDSNIDDKVDLVIGDLVDQVVNEKDTDADVDVDVDVEDDESEVDDESENESENEEEMKRKDNYEHSTQLLCHSPYKQADASEDCESKLVRKLSRHASLTIMSVDGMRMAWVKLENNENEVSETKEDKEIDESAEGKCQKMIDSHSFRILSPKLTDGPVVLLDSDDERQINEFIDSIHIEGENEEKSDEEYEDQEMENHQQVVQETQIDQKSDQILEEMDNTTNEESCIRIRDEEYDFLFDQDCLSRFNKPQLRACKQLIESEKVYVADLHALLQGYLIPLRECVRELGLTMETQMAFSSTLAVAELIYDLNDSTLKQMLNCTSTIQQPYIVAEAFSDFTPFGRLYQDYCRNFHRMLDSIKASHKTPALKSKLEDCSRNSLCRELPLEVFLIKPIQRVCEYPGQLSRMLKDMSPNHKVFPTLFTASKGVQEIVFKLQEQMKSHESMAKIVLLADTVGGVPSDLVQPHRHFMIEASCKLSKKRGKWKDYSIYLFNDVLLLARPQMLRKQKFKEMLELSQLKIERNTQDCGPTEFEIVDKSSKNTYRLQFKARDQMHVIMTTIERLSTEWTQMSVDQRAALQDSQRRAWVARRKALTSLSGLESRYHDQRDTSKAINLRRSKVQAQETLVNPNSGDKKSVKEKKSISLWSRKGSTLDSGKKRDKSGFAGMFRL